MREWEREREGERERERNGEKGKRERERERKTEGREVRERERERESERERERGRKGAVLALNLCCAFWNILIVRRIPVPDAYKETTEREHTFSIASCSSRSGRWPPTAYM
jgi:hypothetical protein